MLNDFLSSHSSKEKVVEISIEPKTVYMTPSRNTLDLNFDFLIEGLTDRNLIIRFIKVAVYDRNDELMSCRLTVAPSKTLEAKILPQVPNPNCKLPAPIITIFVDAILLFKSFR